MSERSSVVVGGGIAGMLSAWMLAKRGDQVTLIEREADLGGLLRSFDYGPWGRFDYGAHNVGEIGIGEIDDLFYSLLSPDEWNVLEGARRDLAGVFFQGQLGAGSVYADLRGLPQDVYAEATKEFLSRAESAAQPLAANARDYLIGRFGPVIGEKIMIPVVEKLFRRSAGDLDTFATMLTSLDRVILFDESKTLDFYQSPSIKERLAFPDQRRLPDGFSSGRRALYPKKYGMYRFIEAFQNRLKVLGVDIFTESTVSSLVAENGLVSAVNFFEKESPKTSTVSGSFIWTIGIIPLTMLMGRKPPSGGDKPPKTVIVSFLLDRPLTTDLFYFYCYDKGFRTFRVTNFSAFCDGAARSGGYPVSVEVLLDQSENVEADELVSQTERELFSFGVTDAKAKVLFSRAEFLSAGFPMPSLTNMNANTEARAWLEAQNLANLKAVGILSKPRLFFQKDVLKEIYQVLS